MEKLCEFCTGLRPVVFCQADSAHLCLSCDAKVHSANALSNRHLRTILCDACRYRPVYIQCLAHRMFMCRGCDSSLHDVSSQHQKQAVSSYMGCPSAKHFAEMWGFELKDLGNNAVHGHHSSTSCGAVNQNTTDENTLRQFCSQVGASSVASKVNFMMSVSGAEFEMGSSCQQHKIYYRCSHQQENGFILQQILDLKRLQLIEGNSHLPLIHHQEPTEILSSIYNLSEELDENPDQGLQQFQDPDTDLQESENSGQEQKLDILPSPFSQLENLSSSSNVGVSMPGESFWQCRSPNQSSQLWSQNMQDLGVCEDIVSQDDFNIPDVDLTFRNFEELFGGDQHPTRPLLRDKHLPCSYVANDISVDRSDKGNARELEDVSMTSSAHTILPPQMERDTSTKFHDSARSMSSACPVQLFRSTVSSMSRFNAGSIKNDCFDNGLSPVNGEEVSCHSPDPEGANTNARENGMMRYRKRKKAQLKHFSWIQA